MTKPESADFEEKRECSGTDEEWLELIKIVVSMATTQGGSIEIARLQTHSGELDSARIDVGVGVNPLS